VNILARLSLPVVAYALARTLEPPPCSAAQRAPAQALVILGGGVVGTQAAALVVRPAAAPVARPAAVAPTEPIAVPRDLETALESFDFDALDLGPAPKSSRPPDQLDSPETPNKA
jgi:hypothetical protein